ncbi:MAG: MBL fold metallo-hydrolase [Deltaproteobacteria bacterium]|nr:MBL fold metallo-hydrolase [Deltaproteobacteria bacterium]
MKITQIRNATLRIEFGGFRFLVDPVLADKDSYPGFPGTYNDHLKWPKVDLPLPVSEVINVDAVIVTHTHEDHFDRAAMEEIRKDMPIFAQDEDDARGISSAGFTDVRILTEKSTFGSVSLIKTPGQHGSDKVIAAIGKRLGEVCGVIFKSENEKILYLAGDTTWNRYVEDTLLRYSPDVIILNSGDAQVLGLGSIIMNKEDVYKVFKAAPRATLIASHMEAVNHAALTRVELRDYSAETGMIDRLLVPEDGETVIF